MNLKCCYTNEELIEAVKNSLSYAEVLRTLGIKPSGGNYKTIKNAITKLSLDISHFTGSAWNQGIKYRNICPGRLLSDILIENSTYKSTTSLKNRLIKEGVKETKCECCGNKEWQGNPIPLELHHIDGNHSNLKLENLQLLCPNCHALTDNYKGKNITKFKKEPLKSSIQILSEEEAKEREQKRRESRRIPIEEWKRKPLPDKICPICGKTFHPDSKTTKFCSLDCYNKARSKTRPSYEELINKLKENKGNFTAVGRFYEVTDNAVRKWCRLYKISDKSKDYNNSLL